MNRRTFLSGIGAALVGLDLTFGSRSIADAKAAIRPKTFSEEEYRLVEPRTALEDLRIGAIVAYDRAADGVRRAVLNDPFYGCCETATPKGSLAMICTRGPAALRVYNVFEARSIPAISLGKTLESDN